MGEVPEMDGAAIEKARQTDMKPRRGAYSVGIYARLSVDSHGVKNESIAAQTEIAKAFVARQPDMVLFDCYSDIGKSGTDFARDGFQRLMEDVRQRKVNCIIVKDLSRFGRNYIETGNYIEKIFPFLGVRLIAVTDGFDSLYPAGSGLSVNLKNLTNELYAKDIAAKVRSSRAVQRELGGYIGGAAPYGYRAERAGGGRRLFVDETAAAVVEKLYALAGAGKSVRELIVWLYEQGVHRPADYRRCGHVFCGRGETLRQWSESTVRAVLTNPVYAGGAERTGAHKAIVDVEQFSRAADRFTKRAAVGGVRSFYRNAEKERDVFCGLLVCGECGARMTRTGYRKKAGCGGKIVYGYYCRHAARIDGKPCERKYVTRDVLARSVNAALGQAAVVCGVRQAVLTQRAQEAAGQKRRALEKELQAVVRQIARGKVEESGLYRKYRGREIGREAFMRRKEEWEGQIKRLREKQTEVERRLGEQEKAMAALGRLVRELLQFDENRQAQMDWLEAVLEEIRVFPDKRIEIRFRFSAAALP